MTILPRCLGPRLVRKLWQDLRSYPNIGSGNGFGPLFFGQTPARLSWGDIRVVAADPHRSASPTMVGSPSYCSDPLSPPFFMATDILCAPRARLNGKQASWAVISGNASP